MTGAQESGRKTNRRLTHATHGVKAWTSFKVEAEVEVDVLVVVAEAAVAMAMAKVTVVEEEVALVALVARVAAAQA